MLRLKRILLFAAGVLALALIAYVVYLDHLVTRQFEGRRWTLPAQVYAAPLELYAGAPLTPAQLEQELRRLQYRRTDKADHPGSYSVSAATISRLTP